MKGWLTRWPCTPWGSSWVGKTLLCELSSQMVKKKPICQWHLRAHSAWSFLAVESPPLLDVGKKHLLPLGAHLNLHWVWNQTTPRCLPELEYVNLIINRRCLSEQHPSRLRLALQHRPKSLTQSLKKTWILEIDYQYAEHWARQDQWGGRHRSPEQGVQTKTGLLSQPRTQAAGPVWRCTGLRCCTDLSD